MIKTKFNDSWKFWKETSSFAFVWSVAQEAIEVTLPHDAMTLEKVYAESPNGVNSGFRDGAIYNYVKTLFAPETYREQTVMLKFEGVFMNAFVYVNGELAGKCPYGYSAFYVTLNDFLRYGQENEIRVVVRNGAMTNSRWYSGGGIYRDVYLLVAQPTYISPEGVQVTTLSIDEEYAVIEVQTKMKNRYHYPKQIQLSTILNNNDGVQVASESIPVTLFEGEEKTLRQRIVIENPKAWSEDTPDLYSCITTMKENDTDIILDESQITCGLRILSLDAKRGLRVNGQTIKLRGACIHHDNGLIGAATYDDAEYRRVRILKEAGFNAIRMAHNPMSEAMLRACDALGMYVMDEAFDIWTRFKSDYDYAQSFSEWWEHDIEAMVRKDYNHPSVLLYSVGNEIPEIGSSHGIQLCKMLTDKVKSLDPTRYTLAAINGVFAVGDVMGQVIGDVMAKLGNGAAPEDGATGGNVNEFLTVMDEHLDDIVVHPIITKRLEEVCATTDIAGYNYMTARYESDGVKYPNRVIVGSETYPPEIGRNWDIIKKSPHVIGDFTWVGWDYIGEAGVGIPAYQFGEGGFGAQFPCQLAYCGDIDITGHRRPASYYREIVFGKRNAPYITVQHPKNYGKKLMKTPWVISDSISSWSFCHCEEKPVIVEVYSTGDEVELLQDGISLGKQAVGLAQKYMVFFETTYRSGQLTAITYENGLELGRMELVTANLNRHLAICPEQDFVKADETELIYVPMMLMDNHGTTCTDCDVKINVIVEGAAKQIGLGSGNPKSLFGYIGNTTETFQGRALLILQTIGKKGKVRVLVQAEGYPDAEAEIEVV